MSGYQRMDRGGDLPYNIRRSMSGEGYGGGGQPRGYRPTTARPRSQVVSPWEGGVVPMAGSMRGGSGQAGGCFQYSSGYNQDIVGSINQLNQMGNQESEIALNILNAVLNTSGLDAGHQSQGRMNWGGEPRPSKMRRVNWGDGYESQQRWMGPGMQQGARKMPGQSWGEGPRHAWGYSRNTFSGQDRKKLTAKKGNFNSGGKNQNVQKKKKDTPSGKGPAAGKAPDKDQKKKPDAPAGGGATDQKKKDDAPNVKAAGEESTTTDTKEDIKNDTNTDTMQSETTDAVAVIKETNDDGEKDNQNKTDTTTEGKENNESSVTETGNDNEKKDKSDALPVEARNCHVCIKNFKTPNGYQNHLNGRNHERLATLHMQKCDSILGLLKSQSKLASQRTIVSLRKNKGKITACHKCECPIKGGMAFHLPLREHSLVINFNKCSICKLRFDTRGKLENHRFTPQHLKNQFDFEQRIKQRNLERAKKMTKECDFPEMEAMNKMHDAVDQLILANFNSQAWNPGMIPAYDPSFPIGLNFIERNPQFYCTICSRKILHTAKGALSHFRSQKHYDNYLNYLKNIEGKEKQGDEENQADKDTKSAVNEEMEASEELASLKEVLEEVGESLCDLSESVKETLDSPEQQSHQDEKPSESSEVEASAPTPSESDSSKQPTEMETVDPKSTETVDPKSTEMETVDPKSTEMETVDPKSTEMETVDPKSTEMETVDPKSTEKKTEIPKSTDKIETPSQVEEKSDTPQADQEIVTLSSSKSEPTKKKTGSKLSTSTPAKSKIAPRPVKSKRIEAIAKTEGNASTTSTEIEATEKTSVKEKVDVTPVTPRTPRATAKRGRGRGKAGKIKAASN